MSFSITLVGSGFEGPNRKFVLNHLRYVLFRRLVMFFVVDRNTITQATDIILTCYSSAPTTNVVYLLIYEDQNQPIIASQLSFIFEILPCF